MSCASRPTLSRLVASNSPCKQAHVDDFAALDPAGLPRKRGTRICGLGSASSPDVTIPFYNLLWASHDFGTLVLDYAAPVPLPSPKGPLPPTPFSTSPTPAIHRLPPDTNVRVRTLRLSCTSLPSPEIANRLAFSLVNRAYPYHLGVTLFMRATVLINPNAGQGKADAIWTKHVRPILEAARVHLTVVDTQYRGHGADVVAAERHSVVRVPRNSGGGTGDGDGKEEDEVELRPFDVDATDAVICLSGDGLPYEVFNGLGRRSDARRALARVAVAHIPCGSGNGMCANLYGTSRPSAAALAIVKARRVPIDLASVTFAPFEEAAKDGAVADSQGSPQQQQQQPLRVLSFLSQALGIVADSDLGTEDMRWLGQPRFLIGFLTRLFGRTCYPVDLAVKVEIDDKDAIRARYAREKAGELERMRQGQQELEDARDGAAGASGSGKSVANSEHSRTIVVAVAEASAGETSSDEAPTSKAAIPGADGSHVIPSARYDGSDDMSLPPLRFGTVKDALPDGWVMVPYEKLGNFYCGNVGNIVTSPDPSAARLVIRRLRAQLALGRRPFSWRCSQTARLACLAVTVRNMSYRTCRLQDSTLADGLHGDRHKLFPCRLHQRRAAGPSDSGRRHLADQGDPDDGVR